MISGIEFYKKCIWNTCDRYPIKFDINNILYGDFVFVNLDAVYQFITYLERNRFNKKINIITHNSDATFNQDMLSKLYPYIVKVYCINSIISDSLVVKIPLGFSDRLVPVISNMDKNYNKEYLLYMNFNIHSGRISERSDAVSYFSKFDWVKYQDNIPEIEYYESLKNSKYSVCPIGAGLDTHRFYESIYFDTIPIIKRNGLSDLHSKFPCVIVDDWNEINYEFLNNEYDNLLKKLIDWKLNNQDWIKIEYWMK